MTTDGAGSCAALVLGAGVAAGAAGAVPVEDVAPSNEGTAGADVEFVGIVAGFAAPKLPNNDPPAPGLAVGSAFLLASSVAGAGGAAGVGIVNRLLVLGASFGVDVSVPVTDWSLAGSAGFAPNPPNRLVVLGASFGVDDAVAD